MIRMHLIIKVGLLSAVVFLTGSLSAKAAGYGAAGCGLGSVIIGPEPGFVQVFAATLNATGLQTVGITLGTSNCKAAAMEGKSGKRKHAEEQKAFVDYNYAQLKKEASTGRGDYLGALAELMGCSTAEDRARFFVISQSNFTKIYETNNSEQLLLRYHSELEHTQQDGAKNAKGICNS